MTTIDDHTFDETKLSRGWVIDAGCRGWNFSNYFIADGFPIYAIDIEKFDNVPNGVTFKHAALNNFSGTTEGYFFGNGTGNYIATVNEKPGEYELKTFQSITLEDIYKEIGEDIDLLKLDIEGAEYFVLDGIRPVPRQITVEFHEHCHDKLHNEYIDKILNHLCKFYHLNLYIREWPRYKYLDCLFIRKDLI
jgi:FkbM family methyltransferase